MVIIVKAQVQNNMLADLFDMANRIIIIGSGRYPSADGGRSDCTFEGR